MTAVRASPQQSLKAALLWAGPRAAAAGRSAGAVHGPESVVTHVPDFIREFPLAWHGRTYLFDFAFARRRTILETNGRRWHDDAKDYEHDNEKWSVPCRHGYRIVLATREKITRGPNRLLGELTSTLAAAG